MMNGETDMDSVDNEVMERFVPALLEYNNLRDEEWDFEDAHGPRDLWDVDVCEKHDRLLADIIERRKEVQNLLRVITGNPNLVF